MKIKKIEDVSKLEPSFADIREWYDRNLHPEQLDTDDESVYKNVFDAGRFAAVFQFTEPGAQSFIKRTRARSITDIAAVTSIFRPGPLSAHVDKTYTDVRSGKIELETWPHPVINEILGPTAGCLTGDTLVLTENGQISIKEIVNRDMIGTQLPSYNEKTGEIELDEIVGTIDQGMKNVFVIETEDGTLKLTDDHPVLTQVGWKRADELTVNDELISLTRVSAE